MKILRTSLISAVLAVALLMLGGCRYRIFDDYSEIQLPDISFSQEYAQSLPEDVPPPPINTPPTAMTQTPPDTPMEDAVEPIVPLTYIEATPDDLSPLTLEVVAEDARQYGSEESDFSDVVAGIEAEDTYTDNVAILEEPADDTDVQSAIAETGGVVAIVTDHSALLNQAIGSLFPCQMYYIYAETTDDYVTVARGSQVYQLMVNSGGINVSTRLAADNLTVTDDWVINRNPDIIVKFVDSSILGTSVMDTYAAAELRALIASRPGWAATAAVSGNRIILLSEQMLDTDATRLAAMLSISLLMYPTLFSDVDVESLIEELMSGMEGVHVFSGI